MTCTIWYVILCVLFCLLNIDEFYEYYIKCNTLQVSCTLIFLDLIISNRSKIPKNSWNLCSIVRNQRWLNLPFLPCLSTTAHLYQTPQFSYNFYSFFWLHISIWFLNDNLVETVLCECSFLISNIYCFKFPLASLLRCWKCQELWETFM